MVADLGCLGCAFKSDKYSSPFVMQSCRTSRMRRRIRFLRQNFMALLQREAPLTTGRCSPCKKGAAHVLAPKGGSDPGAFFGRLKAEKWGSVPPVSVLFPR